MTILTLPRTVLLEMSDKYVKIELNESDIPVRKINRDIIESTYGLLKHLDIDPIEYQKKCRDEWERL